MKKILPVICLLSLITPSLFPVAAIYTVDSEGSLNRPGEVLNALDRETPEVTEETEADGELTIQILTENRGQTNKIRKEVRSIEIKPGQNNRIQMRMLDENSQEVENGTDSGVLEIEEPDYKTKVRIRSKDQANYVIRQKVAAKTNFPLQVNLDTNELIVTTPKGSKVVTILPDKAVENMLAAKVLDQLGGKGGLVWLAQQETLRAATASGEIATGSGEIATESGEIATGSAEMEETVIDPGETVNNVIDLEIEEDGTLTYHIEGYKNAKFLGMVKVQLKRVAVVSAETGALVRVNQDFVTRLLDLFSF